MKRIHLSEIPLETAALEASEVLKNGGIILYPTETVYGLGCDALNEKALEKIYEIKERDIGKLVLVLVVNISEAKKYGIFSEQAERLAQHFWPGPLSIAVPRNGYAPKSFLPEYDSVGFRNSNNPFCQALCAQFPHPIISTSANKSGQQPGRSIDEILREIDTASIDLIIDAGELPLSKSSTLVRISESGVDILREGVISKEEITSIL